ncbi:MAG: OmpA family protein [Bacteroidota bacterium]
MYKKLSYWIVLFLVSWNVEAQNLIPNPGFETNEKLLPTWMRNDGMFESMASLWTSPNQGSPDVIANELIPRWFPQRRKVDLTPHKARSGQAMAGIKTYGCDVGTQHCKEYLQIELKDLLNAGEQYYLEYWINPIASSVRVNNFGAALSDVEIQEDSEYGLHYFDPVVENKTIIEGTPNQWVRISGTFTADFQYRYLLIGNFRIDEETKTRHPEGGLDYSYYLIDDVTLRPVGVDSAASWKESPLDSGQTVLLDNIFFELDKARLLPASFAQLDELADLLKAQPEMNIKICGHTDNSGTTAYNLDLSTRRAAAVAAHLTSLGIAPERLRSEGFGDSQPLADNGSPEGRRANRRVTFVIERN